MALSRHAPSYNRVRVRKLTLAACFFARQIGTNVETIPLQVTAYKEITCPEALRQGRAGGALGAGAGGGGIAQKCVEVDAKASNPSKNDYVDVGVFGLVTETKTSMSTLGNGQDGKNDAGQFAMIDKIPAGESDVKVRKCANTDYPLSLPLIFLLAVIANGLHSLSS